MEAHSYFFVSDGDPRFVDVDTFDNRTSTASEISTRRADFRDALIERDENCVLTGDSFCEPCHFIPHSKGDNYMSNLCDYRGEAYDLVDRLDDINDPRNGIVLYNPLRDLLDAGYIAFLKTPNFALTVDDIPYHTPANAGRPASRLTIQHIQPSRIGVVLQTAMYHAGPGAHNSDARLPEDTSQWPHSIIVDLSYATAVLRAWGSEPFIEYVRSKSKDSYYKDGGGGDEDASGPSRPTAQVPHQHTACALQSAKRKKARAVKSADQPTMSDMFDVVMTLWTQAAREAASERRLPGGGDAADVVHDEEKIQRWLESVEDE